MKSKTKLSPGILFESKTIGLFFLGVGVTMLIVNLASIVTVQEYIDVLTEIYGPYLLNGYYVSVISSIILIVYSLYNIFSE